MVIENFFELQLCFPEELCRSSEKHSVPVQKLISRYFAPEKLTENNSYHCEFYKQRGDAIRIVEMIQAPWNLILVVKHFRYDKKTGTRAKLHHDVIYDKVIQLPEKTLTGTVEQIYRIGGTLFTRGKNSTQDAISLLLRMEKITGSNMTTLKNRK